MLRDQLRYKPNPTLESEITELAKRILLAIEENSPAERLILQFASLIGSQEYDDVFFRNLHSHTSVEEFAAEMTAILSVTRISDISRAELIETVELAMNEDEPAASYYHQLFEVHVSMPGASSMIFYPPDHVEIDNTADYAPSSEEIVGWALDDYKVIQL